MMSGEWRKENGKKEKRESGKSRKGESLWDTDHVYVMWKIQSSQINLGPCYIQMADAWLIGLNGMSRWYTSICLSPPTLSLQVCHCQTKTWVDVLGTRETGTHHLMIGFLCMTLCLTSKHMASWMVGSSQTPRGCSQPQHQLLNGETFRSQAYWSWWWDIWKTYLEWQNDMLREYKRETLYSR